MCLIKINNLSIQTKSYLCNYHLNQTLLKYVLYEKFTDAKKSFFTF